MTLRIAGTLTLLGAAAFAQPTISNIETVRVSHSQVTLKFKSSSVGSYVRVRYGSDTTYEASSSNRPSEAGIQHFNWYDLNESVNNEIRIGGLKPGTTYNFCPQLSTDNSTWSACVNHVATTEPLPEGPHPAYPAAPVPVDTARPDTSGYTVRTVASNCSDLQTHIDQAAANLLNNGSVITIPAGTVCTGNYTLKRPPATKTFSTANVNTLTNRITVTGHGFSDNDPVKLAAAQPPGSAGHDIFRQHRGLPSGNVFYARVIDANTIQLAETSGGAAKPFTTSTFTADPGTDTFSVPIERNVIQDGTAIQVVSTGTLPAPLAANTTYYVVNRNQSARTLQLSASSGGAAIDITSAGSGTHSFADPGGGGILMKWPPTANQIVIRTSTPDNQFVPEGVRVTPEFQSKMATIRTANRSAVALAAEDLALNYRFEGIEFTHTDTAAAEIATTINPQHFYGLISLQRATANIIFDRCYIHGLGFPNRLTRAIVEFNGANSAIINSFWEKLDAWTPVREGLDLTRVSNTQFTIGAGTFHLGYGSRSLASAVTVNTSGSAAGDKTGKVYLSMAGALTLDLPSGVSAACSGAPCTVINSATPAFPVNADGGTTVMPIGNLSFSNAALTAVSPEWLQPPNHQRTWEGASSFIAGDIGGRTALINNTISSAGLPVHYDDANGNQGPTGTDYTIARNYFVVPRTQIWSLPESDKLRYGQRQQLEWKSGKRIRIRGNIFEGVFADSTPIATAIAISGTPGPNAAITDVEIGYNIFRHGSGTIHAGNGRAKTNNPAIAPPTHPLQRTWIHNNLAYGIDQYKYRAFAGNNATGVHLDVRGGYEDMRIEHNTLHDSRGTIMSAMWLGQQPNEGLLVADNAFFVNGGHPMFSDECGFGTPACPGSGGKNVLDALASLYTWRNNTMVAGWTDYTGATARTSKAYLTDAMPDMIDAYLQSELAGNLDWFDVANGDFRMGPNASHKSGGAKRASDGLDRGVDMDRLDREVGNIHVGDVLSITASGAVIPFRAPDRGAACTVLYGTGSDPAAWTGRSSPNTADDYARSVTLSGLSSATDYRFRVGCAGTAMTATKGFRTL